MIRKLEKIFFRLLAHNRLVITCICVYGAGVLLNLYSTSYITRNLSASDAGVFFYCLTAFTFASGVARFGLDGSVLHMIGRFNALNDLVSINAVYIAAMRILVWSSPLVAFFFFPPDISSTPP